MIRARLLLPLAVLLAACPQDTDTAEDTDTGEDTNVTGPPTFETFINTTDAPIGGDISCNPGDGTFLTQTVDPALQVDDDLVLTVLDFESDAPVEEANVDVWYADSASGAPDVSGFSDEDGNVTLTVPVCQPISYKTWTDPELEITRDTYEAHMIFAPGAGFDGNLNSVSDTTYKIIPSLLGVSVQADKGIIAGSVYGCDGEKVENAEVIVKDASGNIPESLVVKYFVDDFPNRDQADTSADGLWVAINIPEGEVTVEAYTFDGTEHKLLGKSVVQSYANSINIGNIHSGFGDGVKYPEECLLTP